MGCTVREKHLRVHRKTRSSKPGSDSCCHIDEAEISKSIQESCIHGNQNPNHIPNPSGISGLDDHGWGYCTEEQLEEILLKNLEFLYTEAISKLVSLGYEEEIALDAILRNGHCYGGMDPLTNVLHNSLAYLNTSNPTTDEMDPADLRQLELYSLTGMVSLLQQVRPHLSKGDALWCLLMSDLHVGRATLMEIPNRGGSSNPAKTKGKGNVASLDFTASGFQSNGAELDLNNHVQCPERFNLPVPLQNLLKRNVAMFAAGFHANSKQIAEAKPCKKIVPQLVFESPVDKKSDEVEILKNQDGVNTVLCMFRDMNLDENDQLPEEEQKEEIIITLLSEIKELDQQVKERKEWAQKKAMQAARKLSKDLTELKVLRMEKGEIQKLKTVKQTLDESTMKRLADMENGLRKAGTQVDRANVAVRRLETENAEIKAETEASKLSESEYNISCLEVEKREKKFSKRLMTREKQIGKLQDEIKDERAKMKELKKCLANLERARKDYEGKWKQEVRAKELALAQVEEDRHSKEEAEASNKRRLEALRLKIEIDFQRHKDDLERLEQELSRLKLSTQSSDLNHQSHNLLPNGETIASFLNELDGLGESFSEEDSSDRECIICMKNEVSVVFLPCAHQVLCAGCSDSYGKKGTNTCPSCRIPVEQIIHVFGASS